MVMMFIWGFAFYFPAAPIQIRVVNFATEAPNLASTLIQSGFNLGNAIGPFAGAAALSAGFSYASLSWLGALMALAGVAIALWSVTLERRAARLAAAQAT
jgi:DHA1 family inner membrane transport protein